MSSFLFIDGVKVEFDSEDRNIVDVATRVGINIIAPCYKDGRKSGCCKACVIEVDGNQHFACATRPVDGMNITYKRDDLHKLRVTRLKTYADGIKNDSPCSCSCSSDDDFSKVGSGSKFVSVKPRPLPFGYSGIPQFDKDLAGVEEFNEIKDRIENPQDSKEHSDHYSKDLSPEEASKVNRFKKILITSAALAFVVVILSFNHIMQKRLFAEDISSCNSGDRGVCHKLASIYQLKGRLSFAETYFEKGCSLNYGLSCLEIASMADNEKNNERRVKFLAKACDVNELFGCAILGIEELKRNDQIKNNSYLKKACLLEEGLVMSSLSDQKDRERKNIGKLTCILSASISNNLEMLKESIEYFDIKCKFKKGSACYKLATAYALLNNEKNSVLYLEKSFKYGYGSLKRTLGDSNFRKIIKSDLFNSSKIIHKD